MKTQSCSSDMHHFLAMSILHDIFSTCIFLASHPLHLAYLLFFSNHILSFLAFFYPLLLSTTLLLVVLITISPYLGHLPLHHLPASFLGRTCSIALDVLCSEPLPDGGRIGLVDTLCSIILAPENDAVVCIGLPIVELKEMGELHCASSCFALEEEVEGLEIELALENGIGERSLSYEVLEEIKSGIEEKRVSYEVLKGSEDDIEEKRVDCEGLKEIKDGVIDSIQEKEINNWIEEKRVDCEGLKEIKNSIEVNSSNEALKETGTDNISNYESSKGIKNGIEEKMSKCEALREIKNGIEEKISNYEALKEIKNGSEEKISNYQDWKEIKNGIEEKISNFEALKEIKNGTEEKFSKYKAPKEIKNGIQEKISNYEAPREIKKGIEENISNYEALKQIMNGTEEKVSRNEALKKIEDGNGDRRVSDEESKEFKQLEPLEPHSPIAKSTSMPTSLSSSDEAMNAIEDKTLDWEDTEPQECENIQQSSGDNSRQHSPEKSSDTEAQPRTSHQEPLGGNAGCNSPKPTSIATRVHSRSSSECIQREGSMRKEKEWKRTLACKLYEERMQLKLCEDRVAGAGDGGDNMDMLWEAYEVHGGNASIKGDVKDLRKHDEQEEEEEDEVEDERHFRQLCCLQALKLSTSKMNLGVGKSNLIKISKVLRRMTTFSGAGARRSRKG